VTVLQAGILKDKKIMQRIFPGIEKGPLIKVNALVIHQTGASTAQNSFNSYMNGGNGAHFIIDKQGIIYQTAHLNKKTYHVGKIRSKCYETNVCSKSQLQAVTLILFKAGKSYPDRVSDLHKHEKRKNYPNRYPLNEDSIGIEIVGNYNKSKKIYESVSGLQNQSLGWLIGELFNHFKITKADIYRHPKVSYKTPSEASTAIW
jgi:N-acetyl-anhydromuramyl-L-alanine amidase AmpD